MKYIKAYESEQKYKIGDYVLVPRWKYPYNYVNINNIDSAYSCIWPHDIRGTLGAWVVEEDIERLLTPEEIEKYNELKAINKFNI